LNQVAGILYDHLGLPMPGGAAEKGKKHVSTKEEVLLELKGK